MTYPMGYWGEGGEPKACLCSHGRGALKLFPLYMNLIYSNLLTLAGWCTPPATRIYLWSPSSIRAHPAPRASTSRLAGISSQSSVSMSNLTMRLLGYVYPRMKILDPSVTEQVFWMSKDKLRVFQPELREVRSKTYAYVIVSSNKYGYNKEI